MSETVLAGFGIASGVINTAGLVPYIRDIFRHKTKPERASWWVFLALSGFALTGQVQAGAHWSLVMTIGDTLAELLIAVCSLKYGYGRLHRRDWISLGVAALGIAASQFLGSPLLALLVVVGVDLTGFWLTVYKTWQAPHTETLISWVSATIAPVCGAIAVGKLDLAQLIYPIYLVLANGLLTGVIIIRRPQVVQDTVDA